MTVLPRSRPLYVLISALVIGVGLASRRELGLFPDSLGKYPGDALWTLLVFALLGASLPHWSTLRIGVAAVAFSFVIEFSQLHHAPWIDALRETTLGRLALGSHFNPKDLIAYGVGALLGVVLDVLVLGCSRGSAAARDRSGSS